MCGSVVRHFEDGCTAGAAMLSNSPAVSLGTTKAKLMLLRLIFLADDPATRSRECQMVIAHESRMRANHLRLLLKIGVVITLINNTYMVANATRKATAQYGEV